MPDRIEESWVIEINGAGTFIIPKKGNIPTIDEAVKLALKDARKKNPKITIKDLVKAIPKETHHKAGSHAKIKKKTKKNERMIKYGKEKRSK